MKICPKCQKDHEKPGTYCSATCANGRVQTPEINRRRSASATKYFSTDAGKEQVKRAVESRKYITHPSYDELYPRNIPDWIVGMDPGYIGAISSTQIQLAALKKGFHILLPCQEYLKYDFVLEKEGVFTRIQSKTGRLHPEGYIGFPAATDKLSYTNGRRNVTVKYTKDHIDAFGVFCPETEQCYLVPVEKIKGTNGYLRFHPYLVRQKKNPLWAHDFVL